MREFVLVFGHDRTGRTIILLVILADLALIALHALTRLAGRAGVHPVAHNSMLLLTTEAGYAELFNYLKLFVAACLVGWIFLVTRQAVYAALCAVFLVALGEDVVQLHERVGGLAKDAGLTPRRAPEAGAALAEMVHWSVIGLVLAAVLWASLAASRVQDRRIGLVLLVPLVALGFFAALVDAVHALLAPGAFPGLGTLLTLVEDGGELLSVAVALAGALLLHRHLDRLRGLSPAPPRPAALP
jgi:hypothetical protein